jgi:prepilin-type N-terminal cleavage/methylation domain-containing protein
MPHKRRKQNGLTLAELLITTVIIGVVMIGMVSVDYAVRSSDQQQTRTSLVALRTSAALQDIVTTATQAFGDSATRCVQMGNLTTDATNYICIYRDSGTPSDYSDDSWQCYTRRGTDVHKCTRTLASDKGACAATDPVIGAVTIDTFDAPDTPVVVATSPDFYFQVTLKSRFDPTKPTPGVGAVDTAGAQYSTAIAQEYLTNPKVKLTAKVTPAGCAP